MRATSVLFLTATVFLFGCNKYPDRDENFLRDERIYLLINKKWNMTSDYYWQNGDNGRVKSDNYGSAEYRVDDYVVYRPDFTMEWNDNQILDPNDANKIYTGIWHISDDGKTLTTQLLAPVVTPVHHVEILDVTNNELNTTDVRSASEFPLTYFTTYRVVQ